MKWSSEPPDLTFAGKAALITGGTHNHQHFTLPRGRFDLPPYPAAQLTYCVDAHTAFRARQVFAFGEADKSFCTAASAGRQGPSSASRIVLTLSLTYVSSALRNNARLSPKVSYILCRPTSMTRISSSVDVPSNPC